MSSKHDMDDRVIGDLEAALRKAHEARGDLIVVLKEQISVLKDRIHQFEHSKSSDYDMIDSLRVQISDLEASRDYAVEFATKEALRSAIDGIPSGDVEFRYELIRLLMDPELLG